MHRDYKAHRLLIALPPPQHLINPQRIYDATRQNATTAQLIEPPGKRHHRRRSSASRFPHSQNGLEVIWNHLTRYRGVAAFPPHRPGRAPSRTGGYYTLVQFDDEFLFNYCREGITEAGSLEDSNTLDLIYKQAVVAPARLARHASCSSTRPWTRSRSRAGPGSTTPAAAA